MMHFLSSLFFSFCAIGVATQVSAGGVLVFGGTGKLGAYHVQVLSNSGTDVAVFHRSTSNFDRLEGLTYRRVQGDLLNKQSVVQAIKEIRPSIVIDTSARRGNRMQSGRPFYALAMQHIVEGSKAAGVRQIIIHSSIGVRDSAEPLKRIFDYDTESPNMLDKAEAERILERSGISYTIIRNGLLDYEPIEPTGHGELIQDETVFGRIRRADLARLTLTCIDNADCFGKIFHAVDDTLTGARPSP